MQDMEEAVDELGEEPATQRAAPATAWLGRGMRYPWERAQLPCRVWIWGTSSLRGFIQPFLALTASQLQKHQCRAAIEGLCAISRKRSLETILLKYSCWAHTEHLTAQPQFEQLSMRNRKVLSENRASWKVCIERHILRDQQSQLYKLPLHGCFLIRYAAADSAFL